MAEATRLGDWLKRPISWIVITAAAGVLVVLQYLAPGSFDGDDESGQTLQVHRAPGTIVPHGEEVTAVYTVENRHREAMEVSAVDITYLRIGGDAGPECTGASRAGVQAKIENHLLGKRIGPRGDLDFDVIYQGRDEPHADCVGATIQAEVEVRVVPRDDRAG